MHPASTATIHEETPQSQASGHEKHAIRPEAPRVEVLLGAVGAMARVDGPGRPAYNGDVARRGGLATERGNSPSGSVPSSRAFLPLPTLDVLGPRPALLPRPIVPATGPRRCPLVASARTPGSARRSDTEPSTRRPLRAHVSLPGALGGRQYALWLSASRQRLPHLSPRRGRRGGVPGRVLPGQRLAAVPPLPARPARGGPTPPAAPSALAGRGEHRHAHRVTGAPGRLPVSGRTAARGTAARSLGRTRGGAPCAVDNLGVGKVLERF